MHSELPQMAPAPVAAVARPMAWFEEFWLLLRLQYTDYRGNAPYLVAFGLVMPLGVFWMLQTYVGLGPQTVWLLAGNMVMAVSYGSVNFAMQRTAWIKLAGEMDYYGTLPIRKSAFVAGLFTLGLVSALPGMVSNILIGIFALKMSLLQLIWALPLGLLAAASLTVVGAAVGSMAKSMSQLSLFFYLSYVIVTFLCPVVIPFEKLPLPLKVTSYLLPPGQAALALTEALNGRFGQSFWLMTGALALWLAVAGGLGLKRLDWRKD